MSDTKAPESGSPQTGKLDMSVRVYPTKDTGNLLAFASVNLGGCFAVNNIRVMNSEKGVFVSMPQSKDKEGKYRDICCPTTAEMRKALTSAVLNEYQRSMGRDAEKTSVRAALQKPPQQKTPQADMDPAKAVKKKVDRGDR